MARAIALILCTSFIAPSFAQKKPVTLDALAGQRPPGAGFSATWSPDGKRFVYRQSGKVMLYDTGARAQREILPFSALEAAATKVPAEETFQWENRRVSEQVFEWFPDNNALLATAGGDLFIVRTTGGYSQVTATPFAERDAKLSPDGTRVLYRRDHDVYVLTLRDKKVVRLTSDGSATLRNGELDWVYPEELDLGTAFWWSPDSKSVAYLQFDISRELVHPHVDMLGLFARLEPQRYPKAGTPNADVRLGVVAAGGGRTRWMDLGETREHLLARVYWMPDSSALMTVRLNRVQNQLRLVAAGAASGHSRTVLEEKDPYWINLSNDFRFLPKSRRFLWSSEKSGYRHLYVHEESGRQLAQLTSGDWEVTAVSHVDEGSGRVYFISTEQSPLQRHLYSVSLEGGERRKLTREPGTHSASISPGGEYWTDTWSSLTEPSRTRLMDAAGNAVATLREPDRRAQNEYELLPAEIVKFKSSDGADFYARLIKPAGFDASKKYPAVVMVYGGPHAQTVRDSWAGVTWDQVLAHRGFVIWQMDNRGSAARGHAWEAKLYRRFGKQEVADQVEGVKHLLSLGFVDATRVGISGWSYGGYMTLQALLHAPETFRAGISGAPVTDWRHYDTIYTERYLGLPSENEQGYHDSSPVFFARNLKGKLMLVHNYGDDNVLYQHNLQMQVELQKAGKHFELLVYPQKAHGVTGPLNRHMREATTDFFERTLKR